MANQKQITHYLMVGNLAIPIQAETARKVIMAFRRMYETETNSKLNASMDDLLNKFDFKIVPWEKHNKANEYQQYMKSYKEKERRMNEENRAKEEKINAWIEDHKEMYEKMLADSKQGKPDTRYEHAISLSMVRAKIWNLIQQTDVQ